MDCRFRYKSGEIIIIKRNMKNTIEAEIKIKPISVNKIWQGRRFKTKAYSDFITEALYKMPKRKKLEGKQLGVFFDIFCKSATRSDLDNFLKPAIDLLVRNEWIEDDRFIYFIQAQKFLVKEASEEKIKVRIIEL